VLRKLLNQTRVTMQPLEDGTCELSGRGYYGKLFSGIVAAAMASPKGFTTFPARCDPVPFSWLDHTAAPCSPFPAPGAHERRDRHTVVR
jgi:hypothetical protein